MSKIIFLYWGWVIIKFDYGFSDRGREPAPFHRTAGDGAGAHQTLRETGHIHDVDIDHFKNVNDTYGHATGDDVLKHFAELSRLRLRRVDLFGRLGGEEFGILLPGTNLEGAKLFAERFCNFVAETPAHSANGVIPFTISIGVAEFEPGDAAADRIMARADEALYRAKAGGRNRVEWA